MQVVVVVLLLVLLAMLVNTRTSRCSMPSLEKAFAADVRIR